MSHSDITSNGGMDPRNEPPRPSSVQFKCTSCGHMQMVNVVYGPAGSRYFGSGANWCDACENGKPEIVDPDSDTARLQRHRDLFRTVPANVSEARRNEAEAIWLLFTQRREAIKHLEAILNTQRTAVQAMESEQNARDWLNSISSEHGAVDPLTAYYTDRANGAHAAKAP
jgi:hypothetical protein